MATTEEFHAAVKANDLNAVKLMLDNDTNLIDKPDDAKFSALMQAAYHGHNGMVLLLLKAHANPNYQSNSDKSAMMLAVIEGHLNTIKLLIDYGADIHVQDRAGATALDFAVDFGRADIIKYLIKSKGADPNRRDERGWTPLLRCAAISGSGEAAMQLIQCGADVNAVDDNGNTPLILAVVANKQDLVDVLVKAGCDTEYKSKEQVTAREIAVQMRRSSIVTILPV
eukprot:TRINITY_DN11023_c0_g3_i1.p2 TRINITY_DN11023_c0_g3~~TRINITY_DN11023_c0_g3_i1.p2  ORF type:complete len:226 (+),score=71.98 TRINITY_DN11023_c0_g3_i1:1548-2225(+)